MAMIAFRIIAGICEHCAGARCLQGTIQERHKTIDVRTRTASHLRCKHQMAAAVERGFQLGETAVKDLFLTGFSRLPTTDIVCTASAKVQSGRVHGGALQTTSASKERPNHSVK